MGTKPRQKPNRLAEKLLALRKALGLSQSQMSARMKTSVSGSRMSEYEHGLREPPLPVLLAYARAARVRVEVLIDDKLDLPKRFKREHLKAAIWT